MNNESHWLHDEILIHTQARLFISFVLNGNSLTYFYSSFYHNNNNSVGIFLQCIEIFVADFIHVIFRSARKTTFLVNFKMGFCVHFIHWKTLRRLKEIRLFGGVWLKLWNVFHKNTFSWTEIYNDENDCANNISSIQKCMQKMFLCLLLLNVDMLIV